MTTSVNGASTTPAVVNTFGGNTVSVGNGSLSLIWNDADGSGTVNAGDVIARVNQTDASAMVWTVGQSEAVMAYGDPHMDNLTFSKEGEQAAVNTLNQLFQDAKDGSLTDVALLNENVVMQNAERTGIMSFQGDMTLQTGTGATLGMDVEGYGAAGYLLKKVDLTVSDASGRALVLTLDKVYAGEGGAGESAVVNTTLLSADRAIKPGADNVPTFYEQAGANVSHETLFYGADYGTDKWANVITPDGEIHRDMGRQTEQSIAFFDEAVVQNDKNSMLRFSQFLRGEISSSLIGIDEEKEKDVKGKVPSSEPLLAPEVGQSA